MKKSFIGMRHGRRTSAGQSVTAWRRNHSCSRSSKIRRLSGKRVVLQEPELRGRLLLHVLGRAVHRLLGPRVVGPRSKWSLHCPPLRATLVARSFFSVWMPGPPRQWRCGPRAASSGARLPQAAPCPAWRTRCPGLSFPSSPVSSRAARLVARPTVLDPLKRCGPCEQIIP